MYMQRSLAAHKEYVCAKIAGTLPTFPSFTKYFSIEWVWLADALYSK